MDYSIVYIIGIMFWVLLAIAVVCLMVWAYTITQYYHWDKEARQESNIVKKVTETIEKKLDELEDEDSGGNYPE